MSYKVAHVRGFARWGCDLENIGSIYERVWQSVSWLGFKTIPLVGARLGSQTLAVVREKIGFQALSNKTVVVDGTESCKSRGNQVGSLALSQIASIFFFLFQTSSA